MSSRHDVGQTGDDKRLLKASIFQIKLVHTAIFWVLSSCVVYALFSGITARITTWTWIAVGAVILEGVVLLAFGGICPLTLLAERLGAERGSVADIFLPKWLADRIFPICGTTYGVAVLVILVRVLR
jgi:CBS domain containing-hemolysin-like protein